MSRSVYEVALSEARYSEGQPHGGQALSALRSEFGAGNLYFQVKPVNQTILLPRSVSTPRVSIAQADFPR